MISNRRAAIEDAGMRSHRNRAGFPGICFIAIVHRAASAAGREKPCRIAAPCWPPVCIAGLPDVNVWLESFSGN
ncbi:MAG: hypothetical protein WA615_07020 [Bradyrhizobium sp.]|uniref:hypothetical protein n=1 Tax=Bradyrhizobium sp. TaxID=376 RepID=UPI003C7CA592